MGRVALEHVTKRFGDVVAVDDLTLEVADEEFLVLLGPSGCGKSTALRMIAGLEDPTEGTITHRRPRRQRRRGQGPRHRDGVPELRALPAHDGAPEHRVPAAVAQGARRTSARSSSRDAAESLGLDELLDRKPGAALRRSAPARRARRAPSCAGPQAFLMDEPLSNLDAKLRVQTRAELIELQRRLAATVVYVTHDQVEAMTMGDRIAILDARRAPAGRPAAGRLRAAREPLRRPLHRQPADEHGRRARVDARRRRRSVARAPRRAGARRTPRPRAVGRRGPRRRSWSACGPSTSGSRAGRRASPATVTVVESLGHERHVVCRLDDGQLVIVRQAAPRAAARARATTVRLVADPSTCTCSTRTGSRVDA